MKRSPGRRYTVAVQQRHRLKGHRRLPLSSEMTSVKTQLVVLGLPRRTSCTTSQSFFAPVPLPTRRSGPTTYPHSGWLGGSRLRFGFFAYSPQPMASLNREHCIVLGWCSHCVSVSHKGLSPSFECSCSTQLAKASRLQRLPLRNRRHYRLAS